MQRYVPQAEDNFTPLLINCAEKREFACFSGSHNELFYSEEFS